MATSEIGIRISAKDDAQGALSSVLRGLNDLRTAASSVGATLAGLGIGVSAAGFVAFTQNIINGVDALNDLKDATGASIENISALENIARRSGTGLDTVSTALVKMNQALSSAKPGSDAERAINALGLSVQQLKAQDPVLAFQRIAGALGGYADDANKARLVQELFGKSLKDVAPLLKDTAEAGQLVATVTTEQAEAAEKLNKQFFALQVKAREASRTMVDEFSPTLGAIADEFLRAETAGGSFAQTIGGGVRIVFEAVAISGANVAFVLKGVGREIGGIVAQFSAMGEAGGVFTQAGRNAWAAVGQAMRDDAERARKDLDELESRVLGRQGSAGAGRGAVNPSAASVTPSLGDISGPDKAAQRQAEQLRKTASDYAADLQAQATAAELAATQQHALTEEQKALAKVEEMLREGRVREKDIDRETIAATARRIDAAKALETARQAEEKATLDAAQAHWKYLSGLDGATEKLREDVRAEAERVAALGLSKEAMANLTAARLEEQAALLESVAIKKLDRNLDEAEYAALKEQAALKREMARLTRAGAAKEAAQAIEEENRKAADKAASDWQKAADKIQDSITDALMRGFESGKGFAENLRDTVVNMFKTMVLRPVVEFGVRGGLSALGMGGLAGPVNAARSVGDVASLLNGGGTLAALKGWFTDFGGSAASAVVRAGEYAYQAGFEKLGASMMSWGEAGSFSTLADGLQVVGDGVGYLSAAVAASQGKWGRAIGSGLGTYFGGPIGSAIGGAIGGWVDDAFGGGREYTTGTGVTGRFGKDGFAGRQYQDWRNDGSSGLFGLGGSGSSSGTNYSALDAAQERAWGKAFATMRTQAADFARAVGADATSIESYSKEVRVALGADAEANKRAIAEMFKGLADGAAAMVLDPRYQREGESTSDTLARLATNLTAVNTALDTLGDNMLGVSQSSGDLASEVVEAFGSLQQYQTSVSSYYQRFYTQEERLKKQRQQLEQQFARLGLSVPATTQAYRELVNAQDLTTEAGRKTYAALLAASDSFADLQAAATAAAQTLVARFTGSGGVLGALDTTALRVGDLGSAVSALGGVADGARAAVSDAGAQVLAFASSTAALDGAVGALDETALQVLALSSTVGTLGAVVSSIRTVMLDASSQVLTFSGSAQALSGGLTDSQRSAVLLAEQVLSLRDAADKTRINFVGLAQEMAALDTTTFVSVLEQALQGVATRVGNVLSSIAEQRVAVREAATQIINPTVMGRDAIAAAVASVNTTLPSNAALLAASARLDAASTTAAQAASAATAAQTALDAAQVGKSTTITGYEAKRLELQALAKSYSPAGTYINLNSTGNNNDAYQYDAALNALKAFNNIQYQGYTETLKQPWGDVSTTYMPNVAGLKADPRYKELNALLSGGNAALAAAQAKVVQTTAALATAQAASTSASAARLAAETAARAAATDYAAALQQFAIDAGKSVSRLGRLREETVKYYEAQKALSDLMTGSAGKLRDSVASYRYGQLSAQQQAAQLQGQFATAYASALSTHGDGATLAAYGDKLNNLLGPLIDKLGETGQGNLIASYLAQAEAVAKLLEDKAPKDYQAQSLGLLGSIDSALALLDANTQTAERLITDAIKAGADKTAEGLRAVVLALGGTPAFAAGGYHSGGLRLVGEQGRELEVTGPARYWSAAQTSAILSGGGLGNGGVDALLREVAALRAEVVALRSETRAGALSSNETARILKRVTQNGEAVQTVAQA